MEAIKSQGELNYDDAAHKTVVSRAKYMSKKCLYDDPTKNITLIRAVSNNPVLFDWKNFQKNGTAGFHDAWEQIAAKLEFTVEECKNRWYTLRSTFRRHKGRLDRTTKPIREYDRRQLGSSEHLQWWPKYQQEMMFLAPHITKYNNTKDKRKKKVNKMWNEGGRNVPHLTGDHAEPAPDVKIATSLYDSLTRNIPIPVSPLEHHYTKEVPAWAATDPQYLRPLGPTDRSVRPGPPMLTPVSQATPPTQPSHPPIHPPMPPLKAAPGAFKSTKLTPVSDMPPPARPFIARGPPVMMMARHERPPVPMMANLPPATLLMQFAPPIVRVPPIPQRVLTHGIPPFARVSFSSPCESRTDLPLDLTKPPRHSMPVFMEPTIFHS